MEIEGLAEEIVRQLGLGKLLTEPQRVTGGYMHRMYRLDTHTGVYALKLLNPKIMERPDAMENFRRAEELEQILYRNDIPVVPALEQNGRKMQCLRGQYFYLFSWKSGKVLNWRAIQRHHCATAGRLLADIHKISWENDNGDMERKGFDLDEEADSAGERTADLDWNGYIERAQRKCPAIAEELIESRELLNLAGQEYNGALRSVPSVRCICDGDMDCKNVLWEGRKPYIIDLECLDYGNPYIEMFQLALSWAGGTVCELEFGRFFAFLEGYVTEWSGMAFGDSWGQRAGMLAEKRIRRLEEKKLPGWEGIDWEGLSGIGYGWLDWLAYNVRRALGEESSDREEQEMGIREALESIRRIRYYHRVRAALVRAVKEWQAGAFASVKDRPERG